ncbi:leucine-rich repeat-containing protein 47-like [Anopheles ziemanni]|uniref:leucine-rich repeat-containing protein 47-like n=1 Tax=Anopheles coustani TaxID=139045 RepID=UPI00265A9D56|nr:leucine-rich repeat-containing protein 47-like [Anopheles coustani]XP_058172183.1 leucine-rich repeat-containing protein 47-like [Anopheles ziemanni]
MWPEVEAAKTDNRREIKLTGANVSKRIDANGGRLDEAIYKLTALNLLDVNDTSLQTISPQVKELRHLQSLLLFRNKITQIPATIGQLSELKVLDLSGNKICTLPDELTALRSLTTLNLSFNQLQTLDLSKLDQLSVCNLSGNELTEVPQFYTGQVHHLTDVNLEKNRIVSLPEVLTQQQILKVLNVADNKIEQVPKYLTKCIKLKEINLKGNPLKDKRLLKLVDQCRSKQVLDYVEKNGYQAPKESQVPSDTTQLDEQVADDTLHPESIEDMQLKIMVHKYTEQTLKASFSEEARTTRPYITLCIVRNYPITEMRKFLQMQNSLHDNECMRREVATIATHDLTKIKGMVRYHAAPPGDIQITALGSAAQGKVTAEKYFTDLEHQADQYRKEKKRNTYSGVYKFVSLLQGKELFAFLSDDEKVISLPPLTNCDETKIAATTTDMLLEVTSSVSHGSCVRIMNALLQQMLLLNVEVVSLTSAGNGQTTTKVGEKKKKSKSKVSEIQQDSSVRYNRSATLTVEQVQLFDSHGKLHSVFPGKGDIENDEARRILVEMVAV